MLDRLTAEKVLELSQAADAHLQGGNSDVRRVVLEGRQYAVKDYSGRENGRQRRDWEWKSLMFLKSLKTEYFASPLWRDTDSPITIFTWLSGHRPDLDHHSVAGMLGLLEFFQQILGSAKEANIPMAVDGVRQPYEIGNQIAHRCKLLRSALPGDLVSWVDPIAARAQHLAGEDFARPNLTDEPALMTSPSDFGPHNLLRISGGDAYRVIDLEFFGIDEAHKLIGDTLLHPQNKWSELTLHPFLSAATSRLRLDSGRLAVFLPWLSLKWATIVLARMGGVGFRQDSSRGDCEAGALRLKWYIEFADVGDMEMWLALLANRQAVFESTSR
jgi:hypothetical protein